MRFNPPPNWPSAPPGWMPPPGWQPDSSWPPAPPNWQLWVPEQSSPRKAALIAGGLAVLLVVAVVTIVLVTRAGRAQEPVASTSAPTSEAAESDEDRIADVVDEFEQAWNGEEFADLRGLLCRELRSSDKFTDDSLAEMRSGSGRLDLSITTLEIDDDEAVATIENGGEDPDDIAFVRESGDWKWCEA